MSASDPYDDLIGRLRGRPNITDKPPCSKIWQGSDGCLWHIADSCLHPAGRGHIATVTRRILDCETCRRFARPNSGGSGGDAGILTQSQTMPERQDWDEYFLEIARVVSTRATCPRASIGVVLVDKFRRIVGTGYNGAGFGKPHCAEVGCRLYADHCTNAIHAERNAVLGVQTLIGNASDPFPDLSRLDIQPYIYGPRSICSECARTMYEAGITKEPKTRWPT